MTDKYKNFEELKSSKREGEDFRIDLVDRNSDYLIAAIHGGNIELGTSEVAKCIAGNKFSYYSFEGVKSREESKDLHITSTNFDEPSFCDLASRTGKIISIHGNSGEEECVMVGGLDQDLIQKIERNLSENGFITKVPTEHLNGNSVKNVCNRCSSGKGVQIEISRGLRDSLLANSDQFYKFCNSVSMLLG